MPIEEEIKKIFKGDIATDAKTLDEYSRDASLFEVRPAVVLFPKDNEDVKQIVKFVSRQKSEGENISLTARSAGTDMTGGPLTASIVLSFTRYLNRVKEVGPNYAVTEPGVFYRDFEAQTLKHNLFLPSYPASRELCAIGGIIANNSGGEKTLTYGKTEDYVEELKVVLADGEEHLIRPLTLPELEVKKNRDDFEGEIYRKIFDLIDQNYDLIKSAKPKVSKNSSGYNLWDVYDKEKGVFDLTKLIVGSQGTLGIVTEAKLRLVEPKPRSRLLIIFLKDLKPLGEIINHILQFKPESFESYDNHTFKVAMKLFPQIARRLKGNMFRLAFSFLPEFWMVLTGGIPALILLAEFTGDTNEEVNEKVKKAEESIRNLNLKTKITKSEKESQKYWVVRRESFSLLRQKVKNMRTAPFIDDFIVRPELLPEFLPRLNKILDEYPILFTIAGHLGDGNFHIIPLMDFKKPESKKIVEELGKKVYQLIFEFKGSMSAEHNDGLIRSPYLKEMYGEKIYSLFEETKKIFDPQNIFNPGKKVGASPEYATNHIIAK